MLDLHECFLWRVFIVLGLLSVLSVLCEVGATSVLLLVHTQLSQLHFCILSSCWASLAKRDSFMFWFCPHCHHVSVLVEVPHWLSYCSFVLNFDVGKLSSPILWHFQGFPGHSKPFTFLLLLMQHNSNKFNLQHWVWRDVSAEGCTPFLQRTCVSSQHPH